MRYMEDSSSDGVGTALQTLVRDRSLYIGHPPIQRKAPPPLPSGLRPSSASSVPTSPATVTAGTESATTTAGIAASAAVNPSHATTKNSHCDPAVDPPTREDYPTEVDVGAADYHVSRAHEVHPHHDLHDLLPPWKPLGDQLPDSEDSLQVG